MSAPQIVPQHQNLDGATVLTFPAHPDEFACLHAVRRHLRERGFSLGVWQSDAPAGILIAKWRNLSSDDRAQLHGQAYAPGRTGRHGPITVTIFAGAPLAAHVDVILPQPSQVLA